MRRAPSGLEIQGLLVRFGGHLAVDDLHLHAELGVVTGLIGPNGAGKTTTFNACCGLVRPERGSVHLDGAELTALSPARRAQHGLQRTFQRLELFESMTARENVELGREAKLAASHPVRHVLGRARERAEVLDAAEAAIQLCGVGPFAHRPVARLSTGQRRLVDLARAVAGGGRMLLLDEPSSGLDHDETAAFSAVVRTLVRERGVGVLLVEHDMDLVNEICERLYVLDFGHLIFEGTTAEAQRSPVVRDAYLGTVS